MEGLPPLSLSGGHASSTTGDAMTGGNATGAFNWKRQSIFEQLAANLPLVIGGVIVAYVLIKKGR